MNTPLTVCNGAFEAELVKGQWKYTPTYKKKEKKIDKGSEKEKPQYQFVEKLEKEVTVRYQSILKNTVLDITKFLKTIK